MGWDGVKGVEVFGMGLIRGILERFGNIFIYVRYIYVRVKILSLSFFFVF